MPTVLRLEGLRVTIYPNDHRPAHVHVVGRGAEAVFILDCPDGPVTVRQNVGFPRRDLAGIEAALGPHIRFLCQAWEGMHGQS